MKSPDVIASYKLGRQEVYTVAFLGESISVARRVALKNGYNDYGMIAFGAFILLIPMLLYKQCNSIS